MRRIGGIFDSITSLDNLWGAWLDFRRGKRRRASVGRFEVDAERRLVRLHHRLASGRYQPSGYRVRFIQEPKRRLIAAAPVTDRIVHHAIHRVLAPRLDPGLLDTVFACRPGKGSHRAVLACLAAMRRYRYVLALDVRRYFLAIEHSTLLQIMAQRIKDPRVLALLAAIVASGNGLYEAPHVRLPLELPAGFPGPGRGLPIGNLTSQWWGNHYLCELDHLAKRRHHVPHYQRYMDDITAFSDDPAQLTGFEADATGWLREHRGLEPKPCRARLRSTTRSLRYLGYRVHCSGLGVSRSLLVRARRRLVSALERRCPLHLERSLAATLGALRLTA